MGDGGQPAAAQEPAPRAPDPVTFTVGGLRVTEFRSLIDGKPAHLITQQGVYVIDRVYFADGEFDLGDGRGRAMGGEKPKAAELDLAVGLTIQFTTYTVFIPSGALRATWR